ncbi:MAG: hypothetical protein NTV51_18100, partial [Verrucomicrobia bacterium]|nr:hypothetical protein [Verrucomicrobiota bacterium]
AAAAPLYADTLVTAGFGFSVPTRTESWPGLRITNIGVDSLAVHLDETGLRAVKYSIIGPTADQPGPPSPAGPVRFESSYATVLDRSIDPGPARYPTAPQVSNFTALQAVTGTTATVTWARPADAAEGDSVIATLLTEGREPVYSAVVTNAEGVADSNVTSATVPIVPGRPGFVVITIVRPTASMEAGTVKISASYRTSTTVPLRSTALADRTPPQIVSRAPALDAVGVALTDVIELTFDEPMRARGTLRGADFGRPRLLWSEDRRSVRIVYPDPLPPGPLTLTFSTSLLDQPFADIAGNTIADGTVAARFFAGNLPVITTQPTGGTRLAAGASLTLRATALWPPGGLTYQWLKDGTAVPGATASTLPLTGIQAAQQGVYELRISNGLGTVTSIPTLVVLNTAASLPYGEIRPSSEAEYPYGERALTPGLPLVLTLSIEGNARPALLWRKDGQPIPGATTATLNFASLRESDTGAYDVLLTNASGTAATASYPLVVRAGRPLPVFRYSSQQQEPLAGAAATFVPDLSSGKGFVRGWQSNGQWLAVDPSRPESWLEFPRVSPQNDGVYRYVVSNGIETAIVMEVTLKTRIYTDAPFITGQPADTWFTEISGAFTGPLVTGTLPLSYQWRKNGVDLPGVTGINVVFAPNQPAQAGAYTCVIRNAYGSVETRPAQVKFRPGLTAPEKPLIVDTAPFVVVAGMALTLDSRSSDPSSPSYVTAYQWRRNGVPLNGAVLRALTLQNMQAAQSGNYTVVYSNAYGATESDPLEVRVLDGTLPPYLKQAKLPVTARLCTDVEFFSPFLAGGTLRYRWFLDGREMPALEVISPGHFRLANVQAYHAGTWSIEVSNDAGARTAPVADLKIDPASGSSAHLVNVSTRATAGQGDATLITGFNLNGASPKRILVRAVGPQLGRFGIAHPATNPRLTVYRGNTAVVTNDEWFRGGDTPALVMAQSIVGAFSLDFTGSEAAVITTLDPGTYTLQYASDSTETNAIGLLEAYDLDPGYPSARITNISSRLFVGTGDQAAIPGITVGGTGTKTYLVRAIGPGLTKFGVAGVLGDPKITLSGGTASFSNDDWESAPNRIALAQTAARVGAFVLEPGSKDAALLVDLKAGSYSAVVSGSGSSTGVVLVEVYEVP